MATIEYVQGQESHTSNWGKFYIKGLEAWAVKEEFKENRHDRHYSYQGYVCLDVPDGSVFTLFAQCGTKRGTDGWEFVLLQVDENLKNDTREEGPYPCTWLKGPFRVVVEAKGKVKAPRLMDWWTHRPADVDLLAYAQYCAAHIDKRGVKELPAMATVVA